MNGAQHGTSGNSSERLREIAGQTHTTKANVATALQMISWGLEVNDYGNAQLDADGNFIKVEGEGVTEEMWAEMVAYADAKGWKKGDYKNLNLPFENKFLAQPAEIRERMAKRVEDFAYKMMTEVFNARDTAPLAVAGHPQRRLLRPRPQGGADRGPGRVDRREDRSSTRQGAGPRQGRRRATSTTNARGRRSRRSATERPAARWAQRGTD